MLKLGSGSDEPAAARRERVTNRRRSTDRQAAFEEVVAPLGESPLSNPVNARQVRSKFEKLVQRYPNSKYPNSKHPDSRHPNSKSTNLKTLFSQGRIVLSDSYNGHVSGSSENEDNEDPLFDDNGSSYKSSDQELSKHSTQKRPPLEIPPSS